MTDDVFAEILLFENMQSVGLTPANEAAEEYLLTLEREQIVAMKDITQRDLQFHKAYFGFLAYIHSLLPKSFKQRVPNKAFYLWLKDKQGLFIEYDGAKHYKSISFSKMGQPKFKQYVSEQVNYIYENVIYKEFDDSSFADVVVCKIESEWEKFLTKLI